MNYCRDCKHVMKGFLGFDSDMWKCKTAMLSAEVSPVDGKPKTSPRVFQFCSIKRRYDTDPCGVEGRLWEPKGGGK